MATVASLLIFTRLADVQASMCSLFTGNVCILSDDYLDDFRGRLSNSGAAFSAMLERQLRCHRASLHAEACESVGCMWSAFDRQCIWSPSQANMHLLMAELVDVSICGFPGRMFQAMSVCSAAGEPGATCPQESNCHAEESWEVSRDGVCQEFSTCGLAQLGQLQAMFNALEYQSAVAACGDNLECLYDQPMEALQQMAELRLACEAASEDGCRASESCTWRDDGLCHVAELATVPEECLLHDINFCRDLDESACGLALNCDWVGARRCSAEGDLMQVFECTSKPANIMMAFGHEFGSDSDISLFAAYSLAAIECQAGEVTACSRAGYDSLPPAAALLISSGRLARSTTITSTQPSTIDSTTTGTTTTSILTFTSSLPPAIPSTPPSSPSTPLIEDLTTSRIPTTPTMSSSYPSTEHNGVDGSSSGSDLQVISTTSSSFPLTQHTSGDHNQSIPPMSASPILTEHSGGDQSSSESNTPTIALTSSSPLASSADGSSSESGMPAISTTTSSSPSTAPNGVDGSSSASEMLAIPTTPSSSPSTASSSTSEMRVIPTTSSSTLSTEQNSGAGSFSESDMCAPFAGNVCRLSDSYLSEFRSRLSNSGIGLDAMFERQLQCYRIDPNEEACQSAGCMWSTFDQQCIWAPSQVNLRVLMLDLVDVSVCGFPGRMFRAMSVCSAAEEAGAMCPQESNCRAGESWEVSPDGVCEENPNCNLTPFGRVRAMLNTSGYRSAAEACGDDLACLYNQAAAMHGQSVDFLSACESLSEDRCKERSSCIWGEDRTCRVAELATMPEECLLHVMRVCADLDEPECGWTADCDWVTARHCSANGSFVRASKCVMKPAATMMVIGRFAPSYSDDYEAGRYYDGEFHADRDASLFAAYSLAAIACQIAQGSACSSRSSNSLPPPAASLIFPEMSPPSATTSAPPSAQRSRSEVPEEGRTTTSRWPFTAPQHVEGMLTITVSNTAVLIGEPQVDFAMRQAFADVLAIDVSAVFVSVRVAPSATELRLALRRLVSSAGHINVQFTFVTDSPHAWLTLDQMRTDVATTGDRELTHAMNSRLSAVGADSVVDSIKDLVCAIAEIEEWQDSPYCTDHGPCSHITVDHGWCCPGLDGVSLDCCFAGNETNATNQHIADPADTGIAEAPADASAEDDAKDNAPGTAAQTTNTNTSETWTSIIWVLLVLVAAVLLAAVALFFYWTRVRADDLEQVDEDTFRKSFRKSLNNVSAVELSLLHFDIHEDSSFLQGVSQGVDSLNSMTLDISQGVHSATVVDRPRLHVD